MTKGKGYKTLLNCCQRGRFQVKNHSKFFDPRPNPKVLAEGDFWTPRPCLCNIDLPSTFLMLDSGYHNLPYFRTWHPRQDGNHLYQTGRPFNVQFNHLPAHGSTLSRSTKGLALFPSSAGRRRHNKGPQIPHRQPAGLGCDTICNNPRPRPKVLAEGDWVT